MYSTIVVGTDGSETASGAVSVASELARHHGARLHLVKAYQQSAAAMAAPTAAFVVADPGPESAHLAAEAEEILAATAQRCAGVTVEQHACQGPTAEVLVAVAEELKADLIVVGSRGMHRRILGSVPNTVAHNAPCAVLIVKTT